MFKFSAKNITHSLALFYILKTRKQKAKLCVTNYTEIIRTYIFYTTSLYCTYRIYTVVNVMEKYGHINIKLKELLEKKGLSKNKLSHRAEMERTQINNYCNNKITRLDTDVLSRLCTVLECELSDLLEFIPPEKD